jgi:methylase of polypeptide subunit release factors
VGIGGDLWPAATNFCRFTACNKHTLGSLFNHKSIIELGSGTGLVGLFMEKLFSPCEVVITDLVSHLHLMERNIGVNQSNLCVATELDWNNAPLTLNKKYDVILALEW